MESSKENEVILTPLLLFVSFFEVRVLSNTVFAKDLQLDRFLRMRLAEQLQVPLSTEHTAAPQHIWK